MSQPDSILDQLRSSRIAASPGLYERVRAIAAAVPPAPPRRRFSGRRLTLVLVPACLAVALAGALVAGLATSGKRGERKAAVQREAAPRRPGFSTVTVPQDAKTSLQPLQSAGSSAGGGGVAPLPTTPGRAQLYEAEVTLKVKDLSTATKRALRLTRSFGGYVRTVDYGSGAERGTAFLVVRIPIGSVQAALVRFTAIGAILDQHVSIQDVQPQLDKRFRQMQGLRDTIARLQAKLESPSLTASERKALEDQLVGARRQLVVLQRTQAAAERLSRFATVSLDLRSRAKVVAVPHEPGRLGRALHRSGSILLDEVKVLVYVLIVGAPLLVLAALGFGGARMRRRRIEAQLLSR